MYAVILRYAGREHLRMLDQAHRFVMQNIRAAIIDAGIQCSIEGISDLAIDDRKISGNALRCMRNTLLYHGTLLYGMDPGMMSNCLGTPARQPDWRRQRSHGSFVAKLPATASMLRECLARQWNAETELSSWPEGLTETLALNKYSSHEWTERH